MKPIVAIVGRPNVGKSTLFNRFIGHRAALVEDQPGVTRDRNYAEIEHGYRVFTAVDTGGFDPDATDGMLALMKRQVQLALAEADALVLVLDAREGLTPSDEAIWGLLRSSGRRTYVAVNKVDTPRQDPQVADFWSLGMGELFPISAENGNGVADLLDRLVADLDPPPADEAADDEAQAPTRIAIVGRPNVGKSTLCNALLGQERYLTSEVPGTTRDSVDTAFRVGEREYVLVDTAGIRRPRRVEAGLERQSVARSIQALERCHVAVLVMDAGEGVTDQDKKLASLAIERGRGLIMALNKWDLVSGDRPGDEQTRKVREDMAFTAWAPLVFTTALSGRNVRRLVPLIDKVRGNLFRRIATSELNRFYEDVVRTHHPAGSGTGLARVRYVTQVQVNPPTMLLFAKSAADVPQNYLKFLLREIRARWDFEGVPVRLIPK